MKINIKENSKHNLEDIVQGDIFVCNNEIYQKIKSVYDEDEGVSYQYINLSTGKFIDYLDEEEKVNKINHYNFYYKFIKKEKKMDIKINNLIEFDKVKTGAVFLYNQEIFIKAEEFFNYEEDEEINSIHLKTGDIFSFRYNTLVLLLTNYKFDIEI